MSQIPIIRLEVEAMKYQICMMLSEHAVQMDKDIKDAVDEYCTTANLKRVVQQNATRVLDEVIQAEVQNFFRYGEGRKAVAEAVRESILSKNTFTPLDEVGGGDQK